MGTHNLARKLSILVACLFMLGTVGFSFIEGWPIADAFYMTTITLSTVGYGETHELTPKGRAFTSALISMSIVLMACWTAGITSFLVNGQLSGQFQNHRLRKRMKRMKDHVVVCGGGTTAQALVQRLLDENRDVVVVVSDANEVASLRRLAPDIALIEADAKSEFALMDANILKAKFLIAATESDFDNLLIVVSGKGIGTKLKVISVAKETELASRMFKVGADEVICPLIIGGEHVADLIGAEDASPPPVSDTVLV